MFFGFIFVCFLVVDYGEMPRMQVLDSLPNANRPEQPATCSGVLAEPLNAVRDFRPFVPFVRKLRHRQGEWLQISRGSKRTCVHGFKPDVMNQSRGDLFRVLPVATVHEARPAASPSLRVEYLEQHLTRDGTECGDDVGLSLANLPREHLGTGRCVTDGERGGTGYEAVPPPSPVVDTYGAGDTFAAGVVWGLAVGLPLAEALRLAATRAAEALTWRGAYP